MRGLPAINRVSVRDFPGGVARPGRPDNDLKVDLRAEGHRVAVGGMGDG